MENINAKMEDLGGSATSGMMTNNLVTSHLKFHLLDLDLGTYQKLFLRLLLYCAGKPILQ